MKKESFAITNQLGFGEPGKNPNVVEMKLGNAHIKSSDAQSCNAGICQVDWKPNNRPATSDKVKK